MPYTQNIAKQTVPGWLQYLELQDLLITAKKGKGSVDFHFSQKLGSYRLAYWACETVYAAVQRSKPTRNRPRTSRRAFADPRLLCTITRCLPTMRFFPKIPKSLKMLR